MDSENVTLLVIHINVLNFIGFITLLFFSCTDSLPAEWVLMSLCLRSWANNGKHSGTLQSAPLRWDNVARRKRPIF